MNRMCEFFGWQRGGAKEVRARTRLRQVKLDRRSWFEPKYSDKGDNVLDVLQQPECQRLDTSPVLESTYVTPSDKLVLANMTSYSLGTNRRGSKLPYCQHVRPYDCSLGTHRFVSELPCCRDVGSH